MLADKPDLSRATPRPWRVDGKYIWRSGSGNANVCAVGEPHEGDFVGYKEGTKTTQGARWFLEEIVDSSAKLENAPVLPFSDPDHDDAPPF